MRVLLITHETSRTGAPKVATMVARGLVDRGHDVHVVARSRGPLLAEFQSIAPTSLEFLHRVRRRVRAIRMARFVALFFDTAQATCAILRWRPDLVYINSSAASIYLRPASWLRRRVILHIHESGPVTASFLARASLRTLPKGVSVVACSPSVESDLIGLMPAGADDVHMIASVPDDAQVLELSRKSADWDVAAEEFVVGCCGAVEYRKGADLWVQAAKLVRSALPDRALRFLWIGDGDPPEGYEQCGTEFVGPKGNPYPYIRRFDIFTLPSRDDPFPLVVLEAMLLGRPVVAFGVGGVPVQIGDCGVVVEPYDVEDFARQIAGLVVDEAKRQQLGECARASTLENFSTQRFLDSITRLVSEPDKKDPATVLGVF